MDSFKSMRTIIVEQSHRCLFHYFLFFEQIYIKLHLQKLHFYICTV